MHRFPSSILLDLIFANIALSNKIMEKEIKSKFKEKENIPYSSTALMIKPLFSGSGIRNDSSWYKLARAASEGCLSSPCPQNDRDATSRTKFLIASLDSVADVFSSLQNLIMNI